MPYNQVSAALGDPLQMRLCAECAQYKQGKKEKQKMIYLGLRKRQKKSVLAKDYQALLYERWLIKHLSSHPSFMQE